MEITIDPKPFAQCEIDVAIFKKSLVKNFNLREAVIKSSKVVFHTLENEEIIMEALWYGLDWGKVIGYFSEKPTSKIIINFCNVSVTGFLRYYPGERTLDGTHFVFNEEVISTNDFILIQSYVKNPDHNIDTFLARMIYHFGQKNWKVIIDKL